jgi:hypothetical protein
MLGNLDLTAGPHSLNATSTAKLWGSNGRCAATLSAHSLLKLKATKEFKIWSKMTGLRNSQIDIGRPSKNDSMRYSSF